MRKPLGWLLFCLGILVIMPGGAIAGELGVPAPVSSAIGIGIGFIIGGWYLAHPKKKPI